MPRNSKTPRFEDMMMKACSALDQTPPDYKTALEQAHGAHRSFTCVNNQCFPSEMLRKLYDAMLLEHAATEHLADRDWRAALTSLVAATNSYRLAKEHGQDTWVEDAAEQGRQRCMTIGVRVADTD